MSLKTNDFESFKEKVKEKSDIVTIISRYTSLNANNMAHCPFHNDTNPSLKVYPETQSWYCFGCGKGGDVIRFVELHEKMPFIEALYKLANDAGISLPQSSDFEKDIEEFSKSRLDQDILSDTAAYYHKQLTQEAKTYLEKERGWTEETIKYFQIGFASGGLKDHLTNRCKYKIEDCLEAGVLKKTEEGHIKDYFYKRIIFPNLRKGRVVYLTGRSIDSTEPKYLHISKPIQYLFNENAFNSKEILIVEGIPDCITATQYGYQAIALLGQFTNLIKENPSRFLNINEIYVCVHLHEEHGSETALKIGEILGVKVKIIELPDKLDLNDYFKQYKKEDFETLKKDAKDIIKYQISLIPSDTDKVELVGKLDPILRKLSKLDKPKSTAYLNNIKNYFNLAGYEIDDYKSLVEKYRKEKIKYETEKNNHSKSKEKFNYTAKFEGLVDLVEYEGQAAFLIEEDGELKIKTQIELEGKIWQPPQKEKIPWLLPRGVEVLNLYESEKILLPNEADELLYNDLIEYHRSVSELPNENYYDFLASWVLHTYLLENFNYSPIVCLYAVPERGKTRTGKGMINIAYRGVHVESLREAYLLRLANDFEASIFFDVMDIWKKAEKNNSEDILLHRYEKGAKVPRVLYPERGSYEDTVYYKVFGPTIIATNVSTHQILDTRSITMNMLETSKRFENDITEKNSLYLKERLLLFRARNLAKPLMEISKLVNGRLGDILKPIHQIILMVKPEREDNFLELVKMIEKKRNIEKSETLEAQILKTIINLKNCVKNGILPVKLITDTFNIDREFKITPQKVGRKLNLMGFQKENTENGASAIFWNEDLINRLKKSYGLIITSEISEISETSIKEASSQSSLIKANNFDSSFSEEMIYERSKPCSEKIYDTGISDISDVSLNKYKDVKEYAIKGT